jgi:Na+/proline symporter
MSFEHLGLAGLLLYLFVLAAVAELARRARRSGTPADHFLAGRDLGVLVLFLTLYATAYSGNTLLGYPGEAYRRGFSWIMATGFMLSIIVVFHLLVPKLRPIASSHGFVSPGDWVRHRFGEARGGRALHLAVGLLMATAMANYLLAQLKALGVMAEQVTGGIVTYEIGVVVLAATILAYETVGGMRAVAWTDAAQGVLMLVGLGALLAWLVSAAGGFAEITRGIAAVRPASTAVPDARACANWASTIALMGLASAIYPQAIQRIYAARSGPVLRRSLAVMTFMPLLTTLVVTWIGFAAIPRFEGLGVVEADRVLPLVLGSWAGSGSAQAVAAMLVFLGALAAIMSTADSVLLSLGSIVAEDLLGRSREDPATTRLGKRIAAAVMLGAAVVALVARDVTLWGLIELKMELLIQCVPPFFIALHWKGLRAAPTALGLVVGSAIAFAGVMLDVPRVAGVHLGVIGLGANAVIAVAGSALRRPAPARPR